MPLGQAAAPAGVAHPPRVAGTRRSRTAAPPRPARRPPLAGPVAAAARPSDGAEAVCPGEVGGDVLEGGRARRVRRLRAGAKTRECVWQAPASSLLRLESALSPTAFPTVRDRARGADPPCGPRGSNTEPPRGPSAHAVHLARKLCEVISVITVSQCRTWDTESSLPSLHFSTLAFADRHVLLCFFWFCFLKRSNSSFSLFPTASLNSSFPKPLAPPPE